MTFNREQHYIKYNLHLHDNTSQEIKFMPHTNDDHILFIDEVNGIYVPRTFAQRLELIDSNTIVSGLEDENLEIILQGPDNPDYWEAWDEILKSVTLKSKVTDITYGLHQDGDLWLIPLELDH